MIKAFLTESGYIGWLTPEGIFHRVPDGDTHEIWLDENEDLQPEGGYGPVEIISVAGWIRCVIGSTVCFEFHDWKGCSVIDNFLDTLSTNYKKIYADLEVPTIHVEISYEDYKEYDFNLREAIRHSRRLLGTKQIQPGREGFCYQNAYKYILHNDLPECKLVHGEVTNYTGETLQHAWIVDGDEIIDPTSGVITSKDKYYELLKAKDINTYTDLEAMKMATETKNSGPWTDEERKKILGTKKTSSLGYGGWLSPAGKYNEVDFEGHEKWVEDNQRKLRIGYSDDLTTELIIQGWVRFALSGDDIAFDIWNLSKCRIIDNFIIDNNLSSFNDIFIFVIENGKYFEVSRKEYEENDFNLRSAIRHSRNIIGMKKLNYKESILKKLLAYEDYTNSYVDDSLYGEDDLRQDQSDLRSVLKDLKQDVEETIKDPATKQQKKNEIEELLSELSYADNEVAIQDIRDRTNNLLDFVETASETPFYTGYDFPAREPTGPISHPGGALHLQDMSTEMLMKLVQSGYTHAIWNLHELHPEEDICDTLHGRVFRLEDLTLGLEFNAPIFEQSHPNCICWLLCYSEYDADLPWVIVDAIGENGPVFA